MSKKIILIFLFAILNLGLFSQRPTTELTFNAVDSAAYVQLDSIKIINRTQGGETMIYWPDTILSLTINQGDSLLYVGYATFYPVGASEMSNESSSFEVNQNYPNPMGEQSEISMYIPQKGKVRMMISDLQGKIIFCTDRQLDKGHHSFRFYPGVGNFYVLTVYWNGISRSIQMISTGQRDDKSCRLDYTGGKTGEVILKASLYVNDFTVHQSGILDAPEESQTYTFQFATNIPCPGTPAVEYEGQVYNTIQIFSQCWLKENLNVGTMIFGGQEQSDNSIIEKHCYNNKPDSCTVYGGLYQWDEMMQYTIQQGVRGICPQGWHLPTDEEWKLLEGAVDSQYGIGDPVWDQVTEYRGYDAGTNLKTTSGWYNNVNGTDLFGFAGLPGGYRIIDANFYDVEEIGIWWASSKSYSHYAWIRALYCFDPGILHHDFNKYFSKSVRCLRD